MTAFKKEPKKYKVVRNTLILHQVLELDMKIPNVADEAKVSIATVKKVLRDSVKNDGKLANTEAME
jgi:hypothetical protein